MGIQLLAVAVGGAVGAVGRFLVSRASASYIGTALPYGTLIVNVLGSPSTRCISDPSGSVC